MNIGHNSSTSRFCATKGCKLSHEICDKDLILPPQTRAFHKFHVCFTARWILYQMGVTQSKSSLPRDPTKQFDNHYDEASYKTTC